MCDNESPEDLSLPMYLSHSTLLAHVLGMATSVWPIENPHKRNILGEKKTLAVDMVDNRLILSIYKAHIQIKKKSNTKIS